MPNREDELGALWLKEGKNGTYMSGKLTTPGGEEVQVVVFKNNYKKEEKHPDYRILKSKPKEAGGGKEGFKDDVPF
jgi:uncharacterized protein (DUF736 family)